MQDISLYEVFYSITHHVFGERNKLVTRNCVEEVIATSEQNATEQVIQPPFKVIIHSVKKVSKETHD